MPKYKFQRTYSNISHKKVKLLNKVDNTNRYTLSGIYTFDTHIYVYIYKISNVIICIKKYDNAHWIIGNKSNYLEILTLLCDCA